MNTRYYRVTNKIKERAAFTLGEALVAVIILLLATSIVVAGMPAAIRAYENVVVASNAEVLLSTTMSSLRNELSTSKDITVEDEEKAVSYYSQAIDSRALIYVGSDGVMLQRNGEDPVRLVSEEASAASDKAKPLKVKYEKVSYDKSKGTVTFTNLEVAKSSDDPTPAKADSYTIRVIGRTAI